MYDDKLKETSKYDYLLIDQENQALEIIIFVVLLGKHFMTKTFFHRFCNGEPNL